MPVDLSIENALGAVVQRPREPAARNQRSSHDELLTITKAAVDSDQPLSPPDVLAHVRRLKLATAAEAQAIVRTDRDRR